MSRELPAAGQTTAFICALGPGLLPSLPSTGAQHPSPPILRTATPAQPRVPVSTSPDPSAATPEGWSRDAVAPAACSPRVPAQAHAGPGAHPQPCLWTLDKAQRTGPRVDGMDRGALPLAVALLLAGCSLSPTSRCPGTRGGETRPLVHRPGPKYSQPPSCILSSRPAESSMGLWRVTDPPSLLELNDYTGLSVLESLGQTGLTLSLQPWSLASAHPAVCHYSPGSLGPRMLCSHRRVSCPL